MISIFTIGTIGFWIFLLLVFFIVTLSIEDDEFSGFWGVICIWGFLISLLVFGPKEQSDDLRLFLFNNILFLILGAAAYLMIGGIWSLMKWKWRLNRYVKLAKENRLGYYWENQIKVSNKRGLIIGWMMGWPLSIFWTICYKFIIKVSNQFFYYLKKTFDRMEKTTTQEIIKIQEDRKAEAKKNI